MATTKIPATITTPALEGEDPGGTSQFELDAQPKAPREVVWSSWNAIAERGYVASPVAAAVVRDGVVFFSGSIGLTCAFELTSGRLRWAVHAPTKKGAVKGAPKKGKFNFTEKTRTPESGTLAVAGDTVFTGAGAGVYALDGATGKQRFAFNLRRAISAFPLVAQGLVFVADFRNGVFAFDAVTGKPRWKQKTGGGALHSMAWADGRLVVGCRDGLVRALDGATGKPVWEAPGDSGAGASVTGGRVITSWDDHLMVYELEHGKRLAAIRTESVQLEGPFTCSGERVVFYEGGGQVACADLAKKKVAWRTKVDLSPWSATDSKRTYIAGAGEPSDVATEGELAAFDTKTGERVWSVKSVDGWRCDPRVRPTPVEGGLLVALRPPDSNTVLALVR